MEEGDPFFRRFYTRRPRAHKPVEGVQSEVAGQLSEVHSLTRQPEADEKCTPSLGGGKSLGDGSPTEPGCSEIEIRRPEVGTDGWLKDTFEKETGVPPCNHGGGLEQEKVDCAQSEPVHFGMADCKVGTLNLEAAYIDDVEHCTENAQKTGIMYFTEICEHRPEGKQMTHVSIHQPSRVAEEIFVEDSEPENQPSRVAEEILVEDSEPEPENNTEQCFDGTQKVDTLSLSFPTFCIDEEERSKIPAYTAQKSSKKKLAGKAHIRELLNLTSNGYLSDIENHDPFVALSMMNSNLTARRRWKVRNENSTPGGSQERKVRLKALGTHATITPKEAIQKWKDVNVEGSDPAALIGCKCKVYWPMDDEWYIGIVKQFNAEAGTHHIEYEDGDKEDIVLARESVKFFLSQDDMSSCNIKPAIDLGGWKKLDYQEMAALATGLEDFQEEFGPGEILWAKIKGYPMWPALVMDKKDTSSYGQSREVHLGVQFFGTYERARISAKHAKSFAGGLLSSLHMRCRKFTFDKALEEANRYLREGKLPDDMSESQTEILNPSTRATNSETTEDDQEYIGDERAHKKKRSIDSLCSFPLEIGELTILSLGKIVKDSDRFHNEHTIWTDGYVAIRKFYSPKDPSELINYRMEVARDYNEKSRPVFRVSWSDGELVEASTPSACWKKIYHKLDKLKEKYGDGVLQLEKKRQQFCSGDAMFGFSNPQIMKHIQALPNARVCSKFTGWLDKSVAGSFQQLLPAGYKAVEVGWEHADRCNVCYLDEEYANNLFLQCDKCRILVHMNCYGESEPPNGHLWLCQLCRPGAPTKAPLCCLCPIQGGVMKRTVDGRWAHLTCAMWIPETCLVDVKKMEPIDGIKSINKERWKLTCTVCKVPYGACIQCSEPSCRVAYHVLCARSAGFVLEVLEDPSNDGKDFVEDSEPLCLVSYCKRHCNRKKEDHDILSPKTVLTRVTSVTELDNSSTRNGSGCARTEPYNCARRRGRQEPEVRAAASLKRLYVEKRPYHVGGFCRRDSTGYLAESKIGKSCQSSKLVTDTDSKDCALHGNKDEPISGMIVGPDDSSSVLSVSERYQQMRLSLKHRLTFGKSSIHGWGVFTKKLHRAGDMVIEYAGETVRPIVADLRERLIYNSIVGAGTYMFRIDDEHVVDATRAGSIAHLINHSCEPNCFSRVVTINGVEHIIIFAKRDIEEGEELSYDYRFASKGEQLDCHCGFPSCRGFVNAADVDEEHAKICVPCHEITPWVPVRY